MGQLADCTNSELMVMRTEIWEIMMMGNGGDAPLNVEQ